MATDVRKTLLDSMQRLLSSKPREPNFALDVAGSPDDPFSALNKRKREVFKRVTERESEVSRVDAEAKRLLQLWELHKGTPNAADVVGKAARIETSTDTPAGEVDKQTHEAIIQNYLRLCQVVRVAASGNDANAQKVWPLLRDAVIFELPTAADANQRLAFEAAWLSGQRTFARQLVERELRTA